MLLRPAIDLREERGLPTPESDEIPDGTNAVQTVAIERTMTAVVPRRRVVCDGIAPLTDLREPSQIKTKSQAGLPCRGQLCFSLQQQQEPRALPTLLSRMMRSRAGWLQRGRG